MIDKSILLSFGFEPTTDHCYCDDVKAFTYKLYQGYFLITFYNETIEIEVVGNLKVGFHAKRIETVKELFEYIVEVSQLIGQEKYKILLHEFLN